MRQDCSSKDSSKRIRNGRHGRVQAFTHPRTHESTHRRTPARATCASFTSMAAACRNWRPCRPGCRRRALSGSPAPARSSRPGWRTYRAACRPSPVCNWWTCMSLTCSTRNCLRISTTPRSTTCWCSAGWPARRAMPPPRRRTGLRLPANPVAPPCARGRAGGRGPPAAARRGGPAPAGKRRGPPVLRRIDTSPVGFALFDQLLLTVHPDDCAVRNAYAARLLAALPGASPAEGRSSPLPGARLPGSPADLMLRVIHLMVDGYLDLRRELTRQLDHWQTELLKPRARGVNWASLLQARLALPALDEICEGQRAALQDWMEALETWALPDSPAGLREPDLLEVRSRDVLEHIERVVRHVRRLEQSTETAVQIHFSVQSQRTNDTMRTLTALTAVFLPLNLMAGIFGMNFEFLPLTDKANGFWWALAAMLFIALALLLLFWRKRYLARSGR